MLPAGGRRYFFKKETKKKSDQAQGVSVVAKYLSSSAARDAREGRWKKLDEAGLPEGKGKWEGVCVCGSRDHGCNSENLFNSYTAICTL